MRAANKGTRWSSMVSQTIATKFNRYFTSISQILDATDSNSNDEDVSKLHAFVNAKVPDGTQFNIL